jgi:hypothetical protein
MELFERFLAENHQLIETKYRKYYNYYQLSLHYKRINCYKTNSNDPINYYKCVDDIEKKNNDCLKKMK